MSSAGRLYYMDKLRAIAMLSGVLFHAALAYSLLTHAFMPTADRDPSGTLKVTARQEKADIQAPREREPAWAGPLCSPW